MDKNQTRRAWVGSWNDHATENICCINEPRKQRSHPIFKHTIGYPLQPRRHSRRLIGSNSTWSSTRPRRTTAPNPSGITSIPSGRTQWECPLWKRRASCTLTRRPRLLSFRTNSPQCLPQTTLTHDLKMDGQKYQSIPQLLVRNEGILKLLQHINPSKSSGPDELAGKLLKELANQLAPFLTYLFNKSLETGEVPC